jgi:hypothetical protein
MNRGARRHSAVLKTACFASCVRQLIRNQALRRMNWASVKPIVDQILQSSGPWAALFVVVVLWHLRYVEKQVAERLRDKDREIDRIVRERDQLQEIVLKKRRSSGNE